MICCHGHTRSTSNTDLSVRRGVACMLTLVSGMLHPPAQAVSQLASRSRQPTCWRRPLKVAGQYKKLRRSRTVLHASMRALGLYSPFCTVQVIMLCAFGQIPQMLPAFCSADGFEAVLPIA